MQILERALRERARNQERFRDNPNTPNALALWVNTGMWVVSVYFHILALVELFTTNELTLAAVNMFYGLLCLSAANVMPDIIRGVHDFAVGNPEPANPQRP